MSDLTRAQEVEYQDFEIEVSECRCGYLEVRVLNSPFYRPRAPFKAPYSPQQFQKLMERLAAKPGLEGPQPFSNPEAKAKEIGAELFEALFPDEIAANLRESNAVLAGVSHGGYRAGLRLRIAFHNVSDHPEIFGLPWELLYDPKKKEFLALGGRVLVVRYQDAPRAALKAREGRALRVLSMTPRAKEDEHTFDREEAQSLLDKAVRLEPFVQVRRLREPTLNGLRRKLLQDPCEVLHIFGHGAFRESDATGYLVFENEDGSRDYVSGQQLADHLQDIRELRLVVLVACKGGRLPRKNGQDPYSGVATALVQAGLPAAVAMQQNISVT
ncbi:MAG: CHAT domain-containing protein, partial [Acidobacteriota bacterium]|nr:CHAT domain-containing protein [Acidobacteriota bacterium]